MIQAHAKEIIQELGKFVLIHQLQEAASVAFQLRGRLFAMNS